MYFQCKSGQRLVSLIVKGTSQPKTVRQELTTKERERERLTPGLDWLALYICLTVSTIGVSCSTVCLS
jgi:hypothetical protein